ncbi:hypothetical protein Y032_0356g3358 [Ancylostoma ceylanicum]|nr:hypothetical protein Y032_0356g3358 [Ancylostoma ceylanicum]
MTLRKLSAGCVNQRYQAILTPGCVYFLVFGEATPTLSPGCVMAKYRHPNASNGPRTAYNAATTVEGLDTFAANVRHPWQGLKVLTGAQGAEERRDASNAASRGKRQERGQTTARGDPHASDPADFHPGPGSPDDVYIIVYCICAIFG